MAKRVNKTAKQIVKEYKIKFAFLCLLYIALLGGFTFIMTTNMLLGIAGIVILAMSVGKSFEKLQKIELESVIYEDLDPVKFNEILALGVIKGNARLNILGAISAGDYDTVLEIIENSPQKKGDLVQVCNNLYRKGAICFEKRDFSGLAECVREFERLKDENAKFSYVFNNFSVFDKYDAMVDEDYQYVVDVCEVDLREVNPTHQNHKLTMLNVSFYRAVALYEMERFDEAREAFEAIIEFAPKMHKAKLSKEYLEKMN